MAKKEADLAVVLDCSVALAWYFADEASDYASQVAAQLPTVAAIVPAIWPLEVANALILGERRKRSTQEQATLWLNYLERLPITVEDQTPSRIWSDVIGLARRQNLSAYDASYLELAARRSLPLASLDDKLKAVAKKIGVSLYKPV